MKFKYLGKPRISLTALKNLGSGKLIFVCSCIDLFACPTELIRTVLEHCRKYPGNKYLFQTKNTLRMMKYRHWLPQDCILGTTIETNREYKDISKAPSVGERAKFIRFFALEGYKTFLTIEPILDFGLDEFSEMIITARLGSVNIGADSKKNDLPEPSPEKIKALIDSLREAKIEVKIKSNLKRLIGD